MLVLSERYFEITSCGIAIKTIGEKGLFAARRLEHKRKRSTEGLRLKPQAFCFYDLYLLRHLIFYIGHQSLSQEREGDEQECKDTDRCPNFKCKGRIFELNYVSTWRDLDRQKVAHLHDFGRMMIDRHSPSGKPRFG